ncbi:MAG TPA: hypothetical protein VKT78_02555 [Fimbriimonadaceae bacterium]|nr:hypothetical protein [Fimbriimonadaceae bacterium]
MAAATGSESPGDSMSHMERRRPRLPNAWTLGCIWAISTTSPILSLACLNLYVTSDHARSYPAELVRAAKSIGLVCLAVGFGVSLAVLGLAYLFHLFETRLSHRAQAIVVLGVWALTCACGLLQRR